MFVCLSKFKTNSFHVNNNDQVYDYVYGDKLNHN